MERTYRVHAKRRSNLVGLGVRSGDASCVAARKARCAVWEG